MVVPCSTPWTGASATDALATEFIVVQSSVDLATVSWITLAHQFLLRHEIRFPNSAGVEPTISVPTLAK